MADKTQKEKIREKFEEFAELSREIVEVTYSLACDRCHNISSTKNEVAKDNLSRIANDKMSEIVELIDLAIKETEERLVREMKNALPKYPPDSEREELAQKQILEILTNLIRNK